MARITRPSNPTTAHLRAWVAADPKRLASLSEAARKTIVGDKVRGRVHPEGRALYNKGLKGDKVYVEGATKSQNVAAKKAAANLREQARSAGFEVAKRGPLPKAFLASLDKG